MAKTNAERCREITEQILAKLKQGVTPWRCPWQVTGKDGKSFVPMGLPVNAQTGRAYSGVNMMILWLAKDRFSYPHDLWATKKTWERLAGKVKNDEIPTSICYWFLVEIDVVENGSRKRKKIPFQKWYDLYNLAQVEGAKLPAKLDPNPKTTEVSKKETKQDYGPVEKLIKKIKPDIRFGGIRAYYHRVDDHIGMPLRSKFTTTAGYYSTLLHEVGHWTGTQKRLARFEVQQTTEEYAFEELVAELGSCFLLAQLGLPERLDEHPEYQMDQHASYIQSWITRLQNDDQAIWKAARLASAWNSYVTKLNVTEKKKKKPSKKKGKPGRKSSHKSELQPA